MKYDYIIIGSGLGGLCTAIILAKEKKKVLVLEQHTKPGGYLHSFYRKNQRFESGFHFVPELEQDQILSMYWNYLGILDKLNLVPYDKNHFQTLIFPDDKIELPSGLTNLKEKLSVIFPEEKNKISDYLMKIIELKKHFIYFNRNHKGDIDKEHESFEISIEDYLTSLGMSQKLKSVILAQSFLYGVPPNDTPLGTHAIFSNAIYSSAYDIEGGGDALSNALVSSFLEKGGEIQLKKKVVKIKIDDKKISGIETEDQSFYECEGIVSDINPASTLELFSEKIFRPSFVERINELENSISHFGGYFTTAADLSSYKYDTLYLPFNDINELYENPVSNFTNNFFIYLTVPGARTGKVNGKYPVETVSVDFWKNYKTWENTVVGKRPSDYYELKEKILERIESRLYDIIPEMKGKIEYKEGSTPLTNRDFTLSPEGAIYGVKHNMRQMRIPVRARTKLDNFYFTGQSLIFPGIVGVTITSFVTCSDILGQDYIFKKIDGLI
jgi:all-trans-retinol 13,14-reductase